MTNFRSFVTNLSLFNLINFQDLICICPVEYGVFPDVVPLHAPTKQLLQVDVVRSLAELEVTAVLHVHGELGWAPVAQGGNLGLPLDVADYLVALADALASHTLPWKLATCQVV